MMREKVYSVVEVFINLLVYAGLKISSHKCANCD